MNVNGEKSIPIASLIASRRSERASGCVTIYLTQRATIRFFKRSPFFLIFYVKMRLPRKLCHKVSSRNDLFIILLNVFLNFIENKCEYYATLQAIIQ